MNVKIQKYPSFHYFIKVQLSIAENTLIKLLYILILN
jgi:hypothetical protein